MNIIKFKDKIFEGHDKFNSLFKGKYAYWVHMLFFVPMDQCTIEDYINFEKDINNLIGQTSIDYISILENNIDWAPYIDSVETEKANDITNFVMFNNYITDPDITLDELKVFRTWLAKSLLGFTVEYDDNTKHMLEYYANGMYDDTYKWLIEFGPTTVGLTNTTIKQGCGCSPTDTNISSLYNTSISLCNPVDIYRRNIYNKMVEVFSDQKFWSQFATSFLQEFKHYIDNILSSGLPLESSQWIDAFSECSCSQVPNSTNRVILTRLSEALGYMINDDMNGHKNFINQVFNNWASILYEKMYWV